MIKKTSKDSPQEAKNDFIVMAVIALVLIFAFAYLLINIVGQFEKHVQKVRDTKVQYEDSLNWRPDKNLCERRIRDDYENNPNQEKAEYTQLELSENAIVLIGKMIKLKELSLEHSIIEDDWLKHLVNLPLTSLILSGTNVTDNGIPLALKLKDLKVLKLSDTTITDKSLELIAEVPRIKVISHR